MTDEIIQDVWKTKDGLAKEFNYDIDDLATELRKRQEHTGRTVVNLAKVTVKPASMSKHVPPSE